MIDSVRDLDGHKLDFHLEELLAWKRGEEGYPVHLDVGPAGGCNNRCVHCYLKWYGHEGRLLARAAMDSIIEDGRRFNLKSIFLAGSGEPLLNPSTPDFILKAKAAGIDLAMATNAFLLNQDVAEEIIPALNWIRFNVLAYSSRKFAKLHGCPEENRDRVFRNIETFCRLRARSGHDPGVGIGACVLPEAIEELEDLIRFAADAGLDYISLRPAAVNVRNGFFVDNQQLYSQHVERFTEWQQRYGRDDFAVIIRHNLFVEAGVAKQEYERCYGVNFINQVDADGGLYACGCFVGNRRYLLGNLNEQGYSEIMLSGRRRQVLKKVEEMPDRHHCDDFCRCHNINKYLWRHLNPPRDVNFI